ncbi:hypothetical protein [Agromyces lapidis]|uniref:DUF4190 domain-containing protein n=1 Tax=Agromyces lapidis TaxID=279574 RepID=A0ABV5SRY4_9MICO|nr:hypothetical protein [Agromyces lapidis]
MVGDGVRPQAARRVELDRPGSPTTNRYATRARTAFFWALGVGLVFWIVPILITLLPNAQLQAIGAIVAWVGFLPVLVLVVLAIVFGSIGLSRARALGGVGRGAALTGVVGGVCMIALPIVSVFLVIAIAITTAR